MNLSPVAYTALDIALVGEALRPGVRSRVRSRTIEMVEVSRSFEHSRPAPLTFTSTSARPRP